MVSQAPQVRVERQAGHWVGRFEAMASPCEVLLPVSGEAEAVLLTRIAAREALRIEHKFSRYRDDNIVHRIHAASGQRTEVDAETANLLDLAARCHQLSGGLFDITSGVLRRVWRFDGSDRIPLPEQVNALLAYVGWDKLIWQRPWLTLPHGMEIDLGGLGKEYAVDRSAQLLVQHTSAGMVLNYGGDILVTGPRPDGSPWQIAIDDPAATGRNAIGQVRLQRGGLTTSGDARRYLLKEGVRYGHVLDPRSGWPPAHAPRSVTVVADTCLEAGVLSTWAILQGEHAQAFLEAQGVPFWLR